jgi:hypothetical protein
MIDEIRKRTIMTIVKLKIIFSQPRFSGTLLLIRLVLDSVSPFDWRKIKAVRPMDKII